DKLTRLVRRRCAEMIGSIATGADMPSGGRIVIRARHGVREIYLGSAAPGSDVARTLYIVSISIGKLREIDWARAELDDIMTRWHVDQNLIPSLSIHAEYGGTRTFPMTRGWSRP
ncbi:MAG: hypothetical protein ABIK62_04235, partial [candidate division WOR-3 bacterium]